MKRTYKLFSMLLAIIMLMGQLFIPSQALDATATKVYVSTDYGSEDVWELADGNEMLGASSDYSIEFKNGILTLTNASGTANNGGYEFKDGCYAAIYAKGDLTIRFEGDEDYCLFNLESIPEIPTKVYGIYVEGNLTIINAQSSRERTVWFSPYDAVYEQSAGIYCSGNLTIKNESTNGFELKVDGSGVKPKNGSVDNNFSNYGIFAAGHITVGAACTVVATAKDVELSSLGTTTSHGIYCGESITLEQAACVTATAGDINPSRSTISLSAGNYQYSYGVECERGAIKTAKFSELTATGGDIDCVTFKGEGINQASASAGINCHELCLGGGTVTATGGISNVGPMSPQSISRGVFCGSLTSTGSDKGKLTATASDAWKESTGLYVTGDLDIAGHNILATAGSAVCVSAVGDGSRGVYVTGTISGTGGSLKGIAANVSYEIPSVGLNTSGLKLSGTASVTGVGGNTSKHISEILTENSAYAGFPGNSIGVQVYGDITVDGSAVLTGTGGSVTASNSAGAEVHSIGVNFSTANDLTIKGSGKIVATGGESVYGNHGSNNLSDRSFGMRTEAKSLTVNGTAITAKGGNVSTKNNAAVTYNGGLSYGLYVTCPLTLINGAQITAQGGKNPHFSTSSANVPKHNDSYGAYVMGNISITDSVLNATGGLSQRVVGLLCGGTVTLNGSSSVLNATAGEYHSSAAGVKNSYGIVNGLDSALPGGNYTVNSGSLTARGQTRAFSYYSDTNTLTAPMILSGSEWDGSNASQVQSPREFKALAAKYVRADGSNVFVSIKSWTYLGKANDLTYSDIYEGTPHIVWSGTTAAGAAYSSLEKPTDAGNYTVTVTFPEGQTGKADFSIYPVDITSSGALQGNSMTYTGQEQPLGSVTWNYYGAHTLTSGVDFTITGGSATNAGTYSAQITGIGNYTGTREVSFEITKATLTEEDFDIPEIGEYIYSGEPVVLPKPVLKAPKTGIGEITISYSGSDKQIDTVTDLIVFFNVAEGENTHAATIKYGYLTIQKAENPMTLTKSSITLTVGSEADLSEYVSNAAGQVTYAIEEDSSNECAQNSSLSGSTLTVGNKYGQFMITVSAAGTSNYYSAQRYITVNVVSASGGALAFATQPQSGSAKITESYAFTWSTNKTPLAINLQILNSANNKITWENIQSLSGTSATVGFLPNSLPNDPDVKVYSRNNKSVYRITAILPTNRPGTFETVESDTFTITWLPVYTVTFDANGGTGTMDSVAVVSGEYTLPECTFTPPSGKYFKAWRINGTEYEAGKAITVTSATTASAVWADKTVVSNVVAASSTGSIKAAYGSENTKHEITVSVGEPAYFEAEMGCWQKYNGTEFEDYTGDTFEEGTYRYFDKLVIDTNTHVLAKEGLTVTVDGTAWTVDKNDIYVYDDVCWAWAASPEFVIEKHYTVTVKGGSGSGSYKAGDKVSITADDAEEGERFDAWSASRYVEYFQGSRFTPKATFIMPAGDVTMTATYEPDIIEYNTWVVGTQVTELNKNDVLGDGKISYTPSQGTAPAKLTLNNVYIDKPYISDSRSPIDTEEDLIIELKGNNTVNGSSVSAFYSSCDLYLQSDGTGTLSAYGPNYVIWTRDASISFSGLKELNLSNKTAFAPAIYARAEINISDCGLVTSTGSFKTDVLDIILQNSKICIQVSGEEDDPNITVIDADRAIKIRNAQVEITTSIKDKHSGMYARDGITISADSTVTMSNVVNGIISSDSLQISDSNVSVSAGESALKCGSSRTIQLNGCAINTAKTPAEVSGARIVKTGTDETATDVVIERTSAVTTHKVTVTVNNSKWGSVQVFGLDSAGKINEGAAVTLRAAAKPNCRFVCWKSGDTVLSEEAEYSAVITAPITITAVFTDELVYPTWVGGVQISSKNMTDVLGDGKVSYVPAQGTVTAVLTLNGVDLTCENSPVYTNEELIIEVRGNNKLKSTKEYGIESNKLDKNLYINGDGSGCLTIESYAEGIMGMLGKVYLNGMKELDITSGIGHSKYWEAQAIYTFSGLQIKDCAMLKANNILASYNGASEVVIKMVIDNSHVEVRMPEWGETQDYRYRAIEAPDGLEIINGSYVLVEAINPDANNQFGGIYAPYDTMEISDSFVTVKDAAFAIYGGKGITINRSRLYLEAAEYTLRSFGDMNDPNCYYITLNGCALTMPGTKMMTTVREDYTDITQVVDTLTEEPALKCSIGLTISNVDLLDFTAPSGGAALDKTNIHRGATAESASYRVNNHLWYKINTETGTGTLMSNGDVFEVGSTYRYRALIVLKDDALDAFPTSADDLTVTVEGLPEGCEMDVYFNTAGNVLTCDVVFVCPDVTLNGSVKVSGSSARSEITVSGFSGGNALLLVAQYRGDAMVAIKSLPLTASGSFGIGNFSHLAGDTYKAFLLDTNGYAPITADKVLTVS